MNSAVQVIAAAKVFNILFLFISLQLLFMFLIVNQFLIVLL